MSQSIFSFRGRVSRRTCWATSLYMLASTCIVRLALAGIDVSFDETIADVLYVLYLIPAVWIGLSVQIRRWHDLNHSGWWVLINHIPIINLIAAAYLLFIKGTTGPNKYGDDPLEMKIENPFLRYFLIVFVICLMLVVVMLASDLRAGLPQALVAMFASLAICFMSHRVLKSFAFTAWVFTAVAASMVYPSAFVTWLDVDLRILIVPLIQIIMFGMGTTLSVADFARVFKMPWPVLVGFVLQFSVMPLTGFTLAKAFGFDAEVAAGVVLIGSCPGGVASNLMTYLAGGNVALSVTMTSCSTLASPVMTPFLMKVLAGQFIEVNFLGMMFDIINMIIVPIVAGLIANRILYSRHKAFGASAVLALIAAVGVLLAVAMILWAPPAVFTYGDASLQKDGFVVGLLLIGVVALAKLVIGVWLKGPQNWMNKALPIVSMAGIVFIIAIITARSAEKLMTVGVYVIAAAVIHNFVGYLLGYWLARAVRLDEVSCRTIAFEVGMQNGGMASALAMNALKSAPAALAPAIFGPWMNVSGSVLATWWHRKPVKQLGRVAQSDTKMDLTGGAESGGSRIEKE